MAKKRQLAVRTMTSEAVSHWLDDSHLPWLVKDGDSAWNASTVPVGRSCARFAAVDMTLSVAEADGREVAGAIVESPASLGVVGTVATVISPSLVCGDMWIMVGDDEDAITCWKWLCPRNNSKLFHS